jgi:hypothetical protein
MVDALPFLQTKELSAVTFSGEFAQIVPGTSNIVDGEGTSYIDDFEGIATPFHLGNTHQAWAIASTPVTPDNKFDPSGNMRNDLNFGYKRAKIAWHVIDNVFYRSGRSLRPDNIGDAELSNHYVRGVRPQEIFPARDNEIITGFEGIFDIASQLKEVRTTLILHSPQAIQNQTGVVLPGRLLRKLILINLTQNIWSFGYLIHSLGEPTGEFWMETRILIIPPGVNSFLI